MSIQIADGTGKGFLTSVNEQNQLKTVAEEHTMEHFHAREYSRVFVIVDTYSFTGNSVVFHMKNDSQRRNIVFHEVFMQIMNPAGGTTFPSTNTYFVTEYGPTRSSGGELITAVNTRRDSGLLSDTTIYKGPTVSGTGEEIGRWYPKEDADWIKQKHEESFIMGFNDTFQVRLVTDHTSGTALVKIRFSEVNFDLE